MKKIFLAFSVVMLAVAAGAQNTVTKPKPATTTTKPITTAVKPVVKEVKPPAGDAKPGEWYGSKFDYSEGIQDIGAVIPPYLAADAKFSGQLSAKVIEVCPIDGCWLKLEINDSSRVVVKMKNSKIFFPLAAKGRKVAIDGDIEKRVAPVAELQLIAKHLKKTKEEIAAITEPEKEVSISAKGIGVME